MTALYWILFTVRVGVLSYIPQARLESRSCKLHL